MLSPAFSTMRVRVTTQDMSAKSPSIVTAFTGWWSRRTLAQRFATLTALLVAAAAIVQGTVLVGVASHVVTKLETERVRKGIGNAADAFATHAEALRKLPLVLANTPSVERIVTLSQGKVPDGGDSLDLWRQRLGGAFRAIVQANPTLAQVRLIGRADDGLEIVRVSRTAQGIKIARAANLKRHGNHPLFRETARLRTGQVFVTSVEANLAAEPGEVPAKASIRAATPIYTRSGQFFGIILVSASADVWLRNIDEVSALPGHLLAANENGEYFYRTGLRQASRSQIPGSDGEKRAAFHADWPMLRDLFGDSAPKSLSNRNGDRYVSAHRVNYNPGDQSKFVVLAADTDPNDAFADTGTLVTVGGMSALIMALLGALAAIFIARPLKSLMTAARRIAAGQLDVKSLSSSVKSADIGELGEALRIMRDAIETRDTSLRKSELQLNAIVDNTIDGLITIDRDGIIRRYNKGCENIFGYTTSEAIGRSVAILVPDTQAGVYDSLLDRYQQTGRAPIIGKHHELMARHKDGHLIDVEVAIAEITVSDEVLLSGIVRDITERKKLDRMKTEFVSTVTHELRTPLTSIMGSLGLLRSGVMGHVSGEAGKMVSLAYDNGTRLTKLINDILEIDQLESGALEFRLHQENVLSLVMQSAKHLTGYATRCEASIIIDDIPGNIVVETDADRFEQIMGNLISNAAKYSPKGGKITIGARNTDGAVRITVSDQGPGIPASFRPHVFKRFAQADSSDTREKGGTGLGLNITKMLVERMGGRIGFETVIGSGTTFYFELPARRVQPTAPAKAAHEEADTDKRRIA
jgi:PAS domain S-box-containing protein